MRKNIIIDSTFLNIENKTDITLKMDKQIKNVTELRLVSLNYPEKNYNISHIKKNNLLTIRNFKNKILVKGVENISDKLQLTYDDNFTNTLNFSNINSLSGIVFENIYKLDDTNISYDFDNKKIIISENKSLDLVYALTDNMDITTNFIYLSGRYISEYEDTNIYIDNGYYTIDELINKIDLSIQKTSLSGILFSEKSHYKIIPNYRSIIKDPISNNINFLFKNIDISSYAIIKQDEYDLLYTLGFTKNNKYLPNNINEYTNNCYFPIKINNTQEFNSNKAFDVSFGKLIIKNNFQTPLIKRPILFDGKQEQILDIFSYINASGFKRNGVNIALDDNDNYYMIKSDTQNNLNYSNTVFLQINDYNLYNKLTNTKNVLNNEGYVVHNNNYGFEKVSIFHKINLDISDKEILGVSLIDEQTNLDLDHIKEQESLTYSDLQNIYNTYILTKQIELGKISKIKNDNTVEEAILDFLDSPNIVIDNNDIVDVKNFAIDLYEKYLLTKKQKDEFDKLINIKDKNYLEIYKFNKPINIDKLHIKFFDIFNKPPDIKGFNYTLELEFIVTQ